MRPIVWAISAATLSIAASFFGFQVARAGPTRLAGVQSNCGQVVLSKNAKGYGIEMCLAPTEFKTVINRSNRFVVLIGILDESGSKQNAAQCWALYE